MRNTIILLFIVSLMSTPAFAATLFVPDDFQTIQQAVDSSAPGDVIKVGPGQFAGAWIEHQLTIVGSTGTVINEGNEVYPEDAFDIVGPDASGTEIRGMTIDFVSLDEESFGVYADGVDDIKVTKNVFEGTRYGVFGVVADDVKVVNNVFIDNGNSIDNRYGSRWIIRKNIIDSSFPKNTRNGIVLVGANDNEIRKNWIRHAGTRTPGSWLATYSGVLLFDLFADQLAGNVVENNYVEISVADLQDGDISAGVSLVSLQGITDGIVGNIILKNKVCGPDTPVHANPERLLLLNLIEKNKVKCEVYDDDNDKKKKKND